MKKSLQNLARPSAICLIVSLLFVCSAAQTKKRKQKRWNWQTHRTETVDYAKKYPISKIEANLPQMSFERWFRQMAGETRKVNWEINDCGEQTGTSEDRGRDFPMCVESSAKISEAISLRVNIQYGTFKRGISRGKSVVRSIFLGDEAGENGADFDTLGELPDELNRIKKAERHLNDSRQSVSESFFVFRARHFRRKIGLRGEQTRRRKIFFNSRQFQVFS